MGYPQGNHCGLGAQGPRQWVDEGSSNPAGKGGISSLQKHSTEDAVCHPYAPSSGALEKSPTSLSQGYQQYSVLSGPAYSPHLASYFLPCVCLSLGFQKGWSRSRLPVSSAPCCFLAKHLCPEAWPKCQRPVNTSPESLPAHDTAPSLFITT